MAAQPMAPSVDPVADPAAWFRMSGFLGSCTSDTTFATHCTYRLGGPIRLFLEPQSTDDFEVIRMWLDLTEAPHFFIGGGTNLLASSAPYPGLVLRLGDNFKRIDRPAIDCLVIGAAANTAQVLKYCMHHELGGLGVLAGVPGTLGGAVAMNAGTMRDWLDRSILSVTALDPYWQLHQLSPEQCSFRYRGSRLLDEGWRVLETTFRVIPGDLIRPHVEDHLAMRRRTQPGGRNAGSNFKNPPGLSAGALIDQAGCKGWREGGAVVSDLHANFILAESDCTPEDVFRLMQRVARRVEEKSQVRLEPEVVLLNFAESWESTWPDGKGDG